MSTDVIGNHIELTKAEKLALDRTSLAADRNRLAADRTRLANDRTGLASDRTRLAYNRTLLAFQTVLQAWIKTSMALITFGFTIYKFFQIELRGGAPSPYLVSAREYGLAMVVIGLVSLLVATWEYRTNTARVRAVYPDLPRSMTGVVAVLVGILGVLALIVMLLRQ